MISIGIDISKSKSTVCILKPYETNHTETDLLELGKKIHELDEGKKVIMEATSSYHLPVLSYLKEKGIFVSVINLCNERIFI